MGIVSFTDIGPPLTEADIEAFERKLGATLPAPYRRFLARQNGGRPHPEAYRYGHHLDFFLSITDDPEDYCDLWGELEGLREFLPEGVIPIARDESPDVIVLALTGENRGRVYYWISDDQAPAVDLRKHAPWLRLQGDYVFVPDDWPGHPDLKLFAEDFDEFLETFHEPEES